MIEKLLAAALKTKRVQEGCSLKIPKERKADTGFASYLSTGLSPHLTSNKVVYFTVTHLWWYSVWYAPQSICIDI
jgi:hypothetical protein